MDNAAPFIAQVLGAQWNNLEEVIQRYYFLRPYSEDYVCVIGKMQEIYHSRLAKLLIPLGLIFGAIVPFKAKHVPVAVHYRASKKNSFIYWDRDFQLPNKKSFHFRSHMEHLGGNEVVEYVRFRVGMRLLVTAENGAIVFRDNGYIWNFFGLKMPVPIGLFFGRAYVEERPIDEATVSMRMELKHPLFGLLFKYNGVFTIPKRIIPELPEPPLQENERMRWG